MFFSSTACCLGEFKFFEGFPFRCKFRFTARGRETSLSLFGTQMVTLALKGGSFTHPGR
jgi:hypothetical protein